MFPGQNFPPGNIENPINIWILFFNSTCGNYKLYFLEEKFISPGNLVKKGSYPVGIKIKFSYRIIKLYKRLQ